MEGVLYKWTNYMTGRYDHFMILMLTTLLVSNYNNHVSSVKHNDVTCLLIWYGGVMFYSLVPMFASRHVLDTQVSVSNEPAACFFFVGGEKPEHPEETPAGWENLLNFYNLARSFSLDPELVSVTHWIITRTGLLFGLIFIASGPRAIRMTA